jgi:hypothetical protein
MRLIESLFDLIRDCHEAEAAASLCDLAACFSWTYPHLLHAASSSLCDALRCRLLHAGANTNDIVTQYMSMARVLRELDPSGPSLAMIA